MIFLIAAGLFGVFIYLGATIASMVWLAIACAVCAYGFWVKRQKRNALYALGACGVVFAAAGFSLDGLWINPAITSLVVLVVVAYGVLRIFNLKGKKSGGDIL